MIINQYIDPFVMPVLLILCGAIAKKLARGKGWERSDFYLGIELVLLSFGSALFNLYDLIGLINANDNKQTKELAPKLANTYCFLFVSFLLLLWVLSLHQDWLGRTGNTKWQFILLVIVCNIVGIGLLACFVLFVKGV